MIPIAAIPCRAFSTKVSVLKTMRHICSTFPAIVALDEDGEARYDTRTFGEIFARRAMTDDEVFHAMSMVFPDVRLKSYVEIRPADSMPIPYVLAYAALIKGLFYGKSSLETLVRSCAGISESDVAKAKDALMESGICGRGVSALGG